MLAVPYETVTTGATGRQGTPVCAVPPSDKPNTASSSDTLIERIKIHNNNFEGYNWFVPDILPSKFCNQSSAVILMFIFKPKIAQFKKGRIIDRVASAVREIRPARLASRRARRCAALLLRWSRRLLRQSGWRQENTEGGDKIGATVHWFPVERDWLWRAKLYPLFVRLAKVWHVRTSVSGVSAYGTKLTI
jgi:hypothetical protein